MQGMCNAVEIAARQSVIVQLVGRDDLLPAIALNSSGYNLARMIGPAIGAIVIHRFGISWLPNRTLSLTQKFGNLSPPSKDAQRTVVLSSTRT